MPLPPRAASKPLNPEIERLLFQVKVIQEEAVGLLDGLSQPQFDWRPAPNRWSMGECFDHLNMTGKNFLEATEAAVAKARSEGKLSEGPFVYGMVGRWFRTIISPPVKRRFSAPAVFQPGQKKSKEAVVAEWDSVHERMKRVMESASGVDLQAVKVPSPSAKWLKFNLGIYLWIFTSHEKRHLWQARNVRNAAGFPTA